MSGRDKDKGFLNTYLTAVTYAPEPSFKMEIFGITEDMEETDEICEYCGCDGSCNIIKQNKWWEFWKWFE